MPVGRSAPELPLALAHVELLGSRERTRVVCVYGLTGLLLAGPHGSRLSDLYAFGRFSPHVDTAAELLPHPLLDVGDVDIELPGGARGLGPARIILVVTPRGNAALLLDAELTGDRNGERVARLLDITCVQRELLRVAGKPIIEWLRARVESVGLRLPGDLSLGPHVHQCVFPGGTLLAGIRGGQTYWRLIYRAAAPREPVEPGGILQPPDLNYLGYTTVGHGRGVSVIGGFAGSLENMYVLTVVMLITTLGVLHRSRGKLFEVMQEASKPSVGSTDAARTSISRLSAQLNELQLDLEFGVETYLDSVLIPESVVEAFQQSLGQALGIDAGLERSSRMLERLDAVLVTRRAALDAAIGEQAERRDRVFTGLLAVGTLLAAPPALLLAFFALPPDAGRSVLDLRAHWAAYLLAWLPFVVLVLAGRILRARIRARSAQLDIFEGARGRH